MSFEKAIEASLAATLGDDHALLTDLRSAFVDSARRHVEALGEATSQDIWCDAALRLKGLAASFGATKLMACAGQAAKSQCGDRRILDTVEAELAAFDR